jgi:pyruvyltransferase
MTDKQVARRRHGSPSLFVWDDPRFKFTNFGDHISRIIVGKIISDNNGYEAPSNSAPGKLLAVGSILHYARDGDIIWGSGVNGNRLALTNYNFSNLDIRAVRGPLTREFICHKLGVQCPAVFGDPALLLPYLFPEFERRPVETEYIVIPHFSDRSLFPRSNNVYLNTTDMPWREIVRAILCTRLVISSSLHGVIVAEAFGVPARMLRISEHEHLFKYTDYYAGTGRSNVLFARSVPEAVEMGGESPGRCDLEALRASFPLECWARRHWCSK